MGAVVFMVMGVYLVLSIAIVKLTSRYARKNGKRVWLWGSCAALIMYLIPFWDHIPTVLAHKYYCEKEAGFWVYKTPEQWKKENPGVIEGLVANKGTPSERKGDMSNYADTYFLNSRFNWIVKHNGPLFLNRWRHEQEVIDADRSEVLARYIDFSTGHEQRQAGWSGWKFWLASGHCGDDKNFGLFILFKRNFDGVGK